MKKKKQRWKNSLKCSTKYKVGKFYIFGIECGVSKKEFENGRN